MPIRPENRRRYPRNWRAISAYIRGVRAQERCECTGECGLHRQRRCVERNGKPAVWARGKIVPHGRASKPRPGGLPRGEPEGDVSTMPSRLRPRPPRQDAGSHEGGDNVICSPPKINVFDIDVYDCPCGHMYGAHEYSYQTPGFNVMQIHRCVDCVRDQVKALTSDPAYMERSP